MSLFLKGSGLERPNQRCIDLCPIGRLIPVFVMTAGLLGLVSPALGQGEWKGLARQNEYLREHFREEYRLRTGRTGEVYQSTPSYSQRGINSSLGRVARDFDEEREIDRFINRQIQILVDEVDKKGTKMESTLMETSRVCAAAVRDGNPERRQNSIRQLLREVSKDARDLLDRLEPVFRGLEKSPGASEESVLGPEPTICSLAGVRQEAGRSLDALHLFLAGSPVVSAVELSDWNFLSGLHTVRGSADRLSRIGIPPAAK